MTHLANQIAVVTGANSGIGKAIVLALAARGATVCLVGRRMEALQPVAEQASNGSVCYQADLRLDSDIAALVANLKQDVKGVDILVHSAGVIRLSSFECASPDQLDWHYKVNVRAPYLLTQGLLPMIKARQGQIVFVNSTAGLRAGANASQYASTKHALRAVADSLRDEVNVAGIRVLSLFLGRTASPMQARVH
jgi:NADP-dependent 3-hydroxy acid dehydrogenase YdfG